MYTVIQIGCVRKVRIELLNQLLRRLRLRRWLMLHIRLCLISQNNLRSM